LSNTTIDFIRYLLGISWSQSGFFHKFPPFLGIRRPFSQQPSEQLLGEQEIEIIDHVATDGIALLMGHS
jgi:hypothetical protein